MRREVGTYLGGKGGAIDCVLGPALPVPRAPVEEHLAGPVLVGEGAPAQVDIVRSRLVYHQSNVVARVDQHTVHLHNRVTDVKSVLRPLGLETQNRAVSVV